MKLFFSILGVGLWFAALFAAEPNVRVMLLGASCAQLLAQTVAEGDGK